MKSLPNYLHHLAKKVVVLQTLIYIFFSSLCMMISNVAISQSAVCYAVSENAQDSIGNFLYVFDPATDTWSLAGQTCTSNIEAIAYDPFNNVLYGTDAGVLGTLDVATGKFTPKTTIGTINGDYDGDGVADNPVNANDIDGLSYDPVTGTLWASERNGGAGNPDVIFQIDLATCSVVTDAFGPGEDYIVVPPVTDPISGSILEDVDDVAWDPFTGRLYLIQNEAGVGDVLSYYDSTTGTFVMVDAFSIKDIEGLGFNHLQELFGTTGTGGGNNFYVIDETTGVATQLSDISMVHVDFESVDCLTTWSDLALDKVLSPTQPMPISEGDQVCFDITIYNQGDLTNYNIKLSDYVPTGMTLVTDANWSMSGTEACYTYAGPLNPGDDYTVPICFTIDAGFSGMITNTAEISSSEDVNGTSLPDIDSTPDTTNMETGIIDNMITQNGPIYGEDEDDHDIAVITVVATPECAVSSNSPICEGETLTLFENGGEAETWSWSGPDSFTSTNQNPTITDATTAASGTYTVTITSNSVTEICSVDVVVNPSPTVTLAAAGPLCISAAATTLSGSPAGGTYSGTGITDTAAGTFDPATAGVGTHTITYSYTDANGCSAEATTDIVVYAQPEVTLAAAGPYCSSDASEDLTAMPTGGTFSGTGITDGTAGTFDPATAGAGTHTIMYNYTDPNGCTNSATIDIIVHPGPTVSITAAGPYCVDDADATLTGSPTGGTWMGTGVSSTGTFSPSMAGAGTHTVMYMVVDANGCEGVASMDIVVHPLPVITPGAAVCSADLTTYEFSMTTDGDVVTSTSGTVTDDGGGAFTVDNIPVGTSITVTSTNSVTGCSSEIAVSSPDCSCAAIDPPMDITTEEICVGDTNPALTVTVTAGLTADWYDALTGGNLLAGGSTSFTSTETLPGSYTYYVEARDPATGCVSSPRLPVTFIIHDLPMVSLSTAGPFCDGDAAEDLSGMPSGGVYSGAGITDTAAGTFDPAIAGVGTHDITYEYTDANGCTNSATTSIEVVAGPSLTIDPAGPYCIDDAAEILTASPIGGTWSGMGITDGMTGNFDPAVAGAGTHTISYMLTDANGCTAITTIDIVVNPLPPISIGTIACEADLLSYSFTITTTDGNTVSSTAGTVIDQTGGLFNIEGVPAGTDVTVTVIDPTTGCESVIDVTAPDCSCTDVNAPIAPSNPSICEGDAIPSLSAEVGTGETIDWYDAATGGNLLLAGSTAYTPMVGSVAGTYTYYAEAVNTTTGCVSPTRTPVTLTINALPVVTADPAGPFCEGASTITLTGSPVGGTWSGAGITDAALGEFEPSVAGAGTHTIVYTYTDTNGCPNSAEIEIIVHPMPVVTADPIGPFCLTDGVVNLTASPTGGSWSGLGVDATNSTFDPAVAGTGDINLTYVYNDANGCPGTAQITVVVEDCGYDLALTKVMTSAGPYVPGDVVSFDICVVNQGNIAANNVEVTDYIPAGMTFSSSADFSATAPHVATIASIAVGATECVSIDLQIDATFTGTSLTNDAEITADDGDDVDSTPADDGTPNDTANNDDTVDTTGGDDQDPEVVTSGTTKSSI